MKIIHKTLLFYLLFCSGLYAQNNLESIDVTIKLQFNGKNIIKESNYISAQKDTLTFESIRFYLSKFEILYTDKTKFVESNSYHLIDFNHPESLKFSIRTDSKKEIETIQYAIGIDSLTSVSGAMDGDLDATKGMYWAWQSGFINLKIEGKSSSCTTRKNKFQFHVGGYLEPYYALRKMSLEVKNQVNNSIVLLVDLAKLLDRIALSETNTIMIPGKEAMKIADLSINMFSIE